jgi:hypothetical protein
MFINKCTEKFKNADDRRNHCLTSHHFPHNFNFKEPKAETKSCERNSYQFDHQIQKAFVAKKNS